MKPDLDSTLAAALAELPLACIGREYPNMLGHHLSGSADVREPRELHPAFFGCYDWHSAVHGHWTLIALLRRFPLPKAEEIRTAIRRTMSRENLLAEAAYLDQPHRESFERMYGWAWLLKLALELREWDDEDGRQWAMHLRPVEERIVGRYLRFLPKQRYPIRSGVHSNTAFGLTFALDYARAAGHPGLASTIEAAARRYYLGDRGYSVAFEPSGNDFLSPALAEADLMRRVLSINEFPNWFEEFLPDPSPILSPAEVDDRADPQIGHLDGLNLSRAWCLRGIGGALLPGALRTRFEESASRHAEAGLAGVRSGEYAGEHWLASFAVYLMTG